MTPHLSQFLSLREGGREVNAGARSAGQRVGKLAFAARTWAGPARFLQISTGTRPGRPYSGRAGFALPTFPPKGGEGWSMAVSDRKSALTRPKARVLFGVSGLTQESSNIHLARIDAVPDSRYSQGQIPTLGRHRQPAVFPGSPGRKLCSAARIPVRNQGSCPLSRNLSPISC